MRTQLAGLSGGLLSAPALAQITTSAAPPLPVPTLPTWAVGLLAVALLALLIRSTRHPALRSMMGVLVVSAVLWQHPELRAQLGLAFTDPVGETLEIPAVPLREAGNIVDFETLIYQNDTRSRLMITDVTPPGYEACFPDPLTVPLPERVPADPAAPLCAPDLIVSNGWSCQVDVAAACRDALERNQADITVTPDSALILVDAPIETFTISNAATSPRAADDLAITLPSGITATNDCGDSLAPGDSCTVTVNVSVENSARQLTVQGRNTYPQSVSVTAQKIALSVTPDARTVEAFDGVAVYTVTHDGNVASAAQAIDVAAPPGIAITNNCPSELQPGDSCTIEAVADGAGGPEVLNISGSNTATASADITATEWSAKTEFTPRQIADLDALLSAPVDSPESQCNPFEALPFNAEVLSVLPSALLDAIPSTTSASTEAGFEVRTCGNFTLMVQRELELPVRTLLLIEGDIQPTYGGLFAQIDQSTTTDTIVYQVAPGYEAESLAPGSLPTVLGAAVTRSYGGSLSLKAGEHITGRITLRGLIADVVGAMNYPSENVVVTTGRELPPIAWQTAADAQAGAQGDDSFSDGLKPTRYIELAHDGIWSDSAGIQGLTLIDTTVYYDADNNFGFWGVGNFNSNPIAMFYNGPLKFSKDPLDYLSAQVGFGARDITLGDYIAFKIAYQSRYANLAAGTAPSGDANDTFYDTAFAGLGALPLDLVAVTNSKIDTLNFKSGDPFPSLDHFNLVGLGPTATAQDGTNGPLIKVRGDAELLNQGFGSLDFTASASGVSGTASGDIGIALPTIGGVSLGSFGAGAELRINASMSNTLDRSMTLNGSLAAEPIGGGSFGLTFDANAVRLAIPPSCATPMNLAAAATLTPPLSGYTPGNLNWTPSVSLPSAADLIACADDVFVLIENGVAYVFNQGVALMEFGASLLPENEITDIGIDGVKFAADLLPGQLPNYSPSDIIAAGLATPGVAEAAQGVQDALDAIQAEQIAAAALQALNTSLTLLSNAVAGVFGDAAGAIAGLASDIANSIGSFITGGGDTPDSFTFQLVQNCANCANGIAKAVDISVGQRANTNLGLNIWAIESSTGRPLLYQGAGSFEFRLADSGLPADIRLKKIDADTAFGAVAVSDSGEIWVAQNGGSWRRAEGDFGIDVGIGGGKIWKIGIEPGPGGYRIYSSNWNGTGDRVFEWTWAGSGHATRIDVGGNGRPWVIQDNYQLWRWNGSIWEDMRFQALDLTVSKSDRLWFTGFDYNAAAGGGRLWTFNPPEVTGRPAWEILQDRGDVIGAGDGVGVWIANSGGTMYAGTGRE